jgi:hypothetical protein
MIQCGSGVVVAVAATDRLATSSGHCIPQCPRGSLPRVFSATSLEVATGLHAADLGAAVPPCFRLGRPPRCGAPGLFGTSRPRGRSCPRLRSLPARPQMEGENFSSGASLLSGPVSHAYEKQSRRGPWAV